MGKYKTRNNSTAETMMEARKKNYGINLRVNRRAKKDDYYDGGEEKEKKKIQDKITKKDKRDVDKANKKMLKDITQKSKNSELEKNPVYQELNRPTDINQFVGGKKIDAKTRSRMNAPENQFNSYNPLHEERYKRSPKLKKYDDFLDDARNASTPEKKLNLVRKATDEHNQLPDEDKK